MSPKSQLYLLTVPVEHFGSNSTVNGAAPCSTLGVKHAVNDTGLTFTATWAVDLVLSEATAVTLAMNVPIFKYLYKRPIRSDFAQNFQIIAFGDVGTAWTGPDPYSDKNSLNTTIIGTATSPLLITLKTQHNPIVGGYGWGMRSRIFGYFVRLDRAWGVQDGIVLKPLWQISLSLDF